MACAGARVCPGLEPSTGHLKLEVSRTYVIQSSSQVLYHSTGRRARQTPTTNRAQKGHRDYGMPAPCSSFAPPLLPVQPATPMPLAECDKRETGAFL